MKNKTFDCVDMVRKIRDANSGKIASMTSDEIIAYFHNASEEFRKQHSRDNKELSVAETLEGYE